MSAPELFKYMVANQQNALAEATLAKSAAKKGRQTGFYLIKKYPGSPKAAAELAAAKKEYEAAQARLEKAIEAYKKSSGGKKK